VVMSLGIYIQCRRIEANRRKRQPTDFKKLMEELQTAEEKPGAESLKTSVMRMFQKAGFFVTPPAEEERNLNMPWLDEPTNTAPVLGEGCALVDGVVTTPTELKRANVLLSDVLGTGQFGQVCRGLLTTLVGRVKSRIPIAIKTISEESAESRVAQQDFLAEALVTW
jgi:hypothetical protein